MARPYIAEFKAFDAAALTAQISLPDEFRMLPTRVFEVVTTGFSGTLDFKGRVQGLHDNLPYVKLGSLAQVPTTSQLSFTTDTGRYRYMTTEAIPDVMLSMTRSAGSITLNVIGYDLILPPLPGVDVSEGLRATYSASFTALAVAAAATDVVTLVGSATKTIRVLSARVSGIATAAEARVAQWIKRSADNTTGTSSNAVAVPHDSLDAAATAVLRGYTANPGGLGAIVAAVRSSRISVSTVATPIPEAPTLFDFGRGGEKPIVLRGVAQILSLNLAGATIAGGLLDVDVTWTEE